MLLFLFPLSWRTLHVPTAHQPCCPEQKLPSTPCFYLGSRTEGVPTMLLSRQQDRGSTHYAFI